MLRLLFAAIRAGSPHGDIRVLRRMFLSDRARYEHLLAEVDEAEVGWEPTAPDALIDPDIVDVAPSADEDEEDREEPPGPNVPNYPRQAIEDAIDNAIDGFEASITDDVAKTLRQVLNRLEILSDERGQLERAVAGEHGDSVRAALAQIIDWADRHRAFLTAP
jgi:hypothetical protein